MSLGRPQTLRFRLVLAAAGSILVALVLFGAATVLLVGHEPDLSGLISLLVAGDTASAVVMKKGGLCKLSTESLKHGRCAALAWLLTPKQMALMS